MISKQNQNQSKQLDIVPGATEQDLIANPLQRQWSASVNSRQENNVLGKLKKKKILQQNANQSKQTKIVSRLKE